MVGKKRDCPRSKFNLGELTHDALVSYWLFLPPQTLSRFNRDKTRRQDMPDSNPIIIYVLLYDSLCDESAALSVITCPVYNRGCSFRSALYFNLVTNIYQIAINNDSNVYVSPRYQWMDNYLTTWILTSWIATTWTKLIKLIIIYYNRINMKL